MKKRFFLITMMLTCIAQPLFAEETVTLETITVEAERQSTAERNVETIDLETEAKPVISTVPDALDKTSGLDIQRRSVLTPKSSQVRVRGFDEKRTLIMLDGRPLNGTGVMGGQFVDWSALPVTGWESVDVGKGAFSAKYGNTLGGTINLVPARPGDDPEFRLFGGYKRYDTFSYGASASARTGPFAAFLSGGYDQTDGHLRNSGVERGNVVGRLYGFWGDDGEIMAGFRLVDGDYNMPVENRRALPGYDNEFPESSGSYLIGPGIQFPGGDRHGDGSFYTKKRQELDLGLRKRIAGVNAELKFYFNNEEREDTICSYTTGEKVMVREAVPDRSWGWTARFSKLLGAHQIGFGGDGNYQGYGGTENTFILDGYFPRPVTDGSDDWDGTRWQGAYLDDLWLVHPAIDLYAGLRFEDYQGDRTVDTVLGYQNGRPAGFGTTEAKFDEQTLLPKLGLIWRPANGLALHGRFARATRFPDNPAFYWYYGGYRPEVDPNSDVVRPDLTYEDALQYEAGLRFTRIPGLSLSLAYYHYDVDDYIRWIFGYAPSRVVYNIESVTFDGVEADVEARFLENFYAFANFTWQKTKKEGDVLDGSNALTDELSELPEMKFNCGVKYERPDGALAKITLRWVDDTEVPYIGDPGAPYAGSSAPDGTAVGRDVTLIDLDSFVTLDVLFKYPVVRRDRFRGFVTAGVENLLDEEYREEFDFPAPGRVFHVGAEVRF